MHGITRSALREQHDHVLRLSSSRFIGGSVVGSWREISTHLPGPGENALIVARGRMSAAEFIPVLVSRGTCERLIVCSFNISTDAVEMLDRMVRSRQVVLADVLAHELPRPSASKEVAQDELARLAAAHSGRVRVRLLSIHAKLIALAMANGEAWVVEGSGNMARNSNIEIYSVFNDPGRLAFHAGWVGRLL